MVTLVFEPIFLAKIQYSHNGYVIAAVFRTVNLNYCLDVQYGLSSCIRFGTYSLKY